MDVRTIGGVRYIEDRYGWIWREHPHPEEPHDEHWIRTGYASLEHVESVRTRNSGS